MTPSNLPRAPLCASVPGSKSLTQRALIIAALAERPLLLDGALACDDSRALTELLRTLGVMVRWQGERVEVTPAPLRSRGAAVWCGNAGTAMRFGACLSLLCDGELTLDGDARMRQRPLGPLGEALERLGVGVGYEQRPGYPPIRLCRRTAPPAAVDIDLSLSSQFASGLLLVAPRLPQGLRVALGGSLVSLPYVHMTTTLMARAGAGVRWLDDRTVEVAPGGYRQPAEAGGSGILSIEPDWSGAAFVLAAGWILGRDVEVPRLPSPVSSLQGDAAFAAMLTELEQPHAHDIDLAGTPDLIAPLAAAAVFATAPTRIRGVAHARLKESDRLAVLARALARLGVEVEEHADGLTITPAPAPRLCQEADAELDPVADHRMAMAFGLLGLRFPSIRIRQPTCVSKSFPRFFATLYDLCWQASYQAGGLADERGDGQAGLGVAGLEVAGRSDRASADVTAAGERVPAGVVLVGLRGTGKSTLAPPLAARLGLLAVDVDSEIGRHAGMTVAEIFRRHGEAEFRRLEHQRLAALLARPGLVVACGGGAVLHDDLWPLIRRHLVVWLDGPDATLARRIEEAASLEGATRPPLTALATADEIAELRATREPRYRALANLCLDTGAQGMAELVERIAANWLGRRSTSVGRTGGPHTARG